MSWYDYPAFGDEFLRTSLFASSLISGFLFYKWRMTVKACRTLDLFLTESRRDLGRAEDRAREDRACIDRWCERFSKLEKKHKKLKKGIMKLIEHKKKKEPEIVCGTVNLKDFGAIGRES